MRTKLLLCAAALAVSALTSMAQVYSLNIVGYYQVTCVPGYTMVANQLTASPDNTVASVLTDSSGVGVNDSCIFWDTIGGFNEDVYYGSSTWDNPGQDFSPGVGVFYKNQGGANVTLTFVGQVPTGTLTTSLPAGYSLVGAKVPQAGNLETDHTLTPNVNDSVIFWDPVGGYNEDVYYGPATWDMDPIVAVGQGFFYKNQGGSTVTWTRTFNP